MDPSTYVDPELTAADELVLQCLLSDIEKSTKDGSSSESKVSDSGYETNESDKQDSDSNVKLTAKDQQRATALEIIKAAMDPNDEKFEPTVFVAWDLSRLHLPAWARNYLLKPYVRMASNIVRVPTDVVMLTHLLLYMSTSVPSAILLFKHFTYMHGILHWLMQSWYVGSYTLMMHQHIHMRGILKPSFAWLDTIFPYITDPLMGHTWNSYFYHHVKHHHVEGNGPNDLSSTIRYQRDNVWHFLHYVGRFYFLIWLDLPRYFLSKGQSMTAVKAAFSELSNYAIIFMAARVNPRATIFVFLLPLAMLRIGLMVGNWGQHALVDEIDPDSDFRSSITLIDVPSNRYCFNDGYHTSHHLNPRRHWREHPAAFLAQKDRYAEEQALVFRNIDYIMMTVRILMKDYEHLAKCLVPIGSQVGMSQAELAQMLERKTRAMSEEQIRQKFYK